MYARHGRGDARPPQRHLRLRDLGRRARRAVPGPRPARRQAAVLRAARRTSSTSPRRSRRCCRRCRRPRCDEAAVADYLTFLWVPDPDTLFEGIYKLPPGHCATLRATGGSTIARVLGPALRAGRNVARASGRRWLRDAVSDAVERQMVSDVPLGSFLSGGLDSGAIVADDDARRPAASPPTPSGSTRRTCATRSSPTTCATRGRSAQAFDIDYHERSSSPTSSSCSRSSSGTWTSRSPTRPRSRPISSARLRASG